jgi:hypothetical protein
MGRPGLSTPRPAPQQNKKARLLLLIAFIQNIKLRHTRHECNANNQYIINNGHGPRGQHTMKDN